MDKETTNIKIFNKYYKDRLCWFWDWGKKYKKSLGICTCYCPCEYFDEKRAFYDKLSDEYWDYSLPYKGCLTVEEYEKIVNDTGYLLKDDEVKYYENKPSKS